MKSELRTGDLMFAAFRMHDDPKPAPMFELNSRPGMKCSTHALGPVLYVCKAQDSAGASCVVLYEGRLYQAYRSSLTKL